MKNNKNLYIIVAIIAVASLTFWWWSSRQAAEAPLDTSDINRELEGLEPNNLDKEFEQINRELENL